MDEQRPNPAGPDAAPEPPTAAEGQVERRIVSVLFADLVGFTSLSERLEPEDVATIQDAYFAAVRETIGRYGGRLEKFIGDAAMAVFGIPRTRDDDAERAVRAGLALVGAIEQVGARLGFEPGDLRLRVGVNTGEVVHAEAGPDTGRVTGDTVNTAARFQTAAAPNTVLLGEKTALAVAGAIDLEEMGGLELKGKAAPVRAWRAVGIRAETSRDHALGRLRAPILGRDDELATLGRWLAFIASGRGARGLIVAPPGVGKTRLVEEFVGRAAGSAQMGRAEATSSAQPVILRARLSPDRVAPYDGVAQLMVGALAISAVAGGDGDPQERAKIALEAFLSGSGISASRASVLAEEFDAVVWPAAEAEGSAHAGLSTEREARFGAWVEGLDALAGERPAVWVVEDVHWAGGDLLAFLSQAASTPARHGRLVLTTSRPSLLEQAPGWTESDEERGVFLMELRPLSAPDAGALVAALVGDALPEELTTAIALRSDGNPLFIEELLRTWISVGTLVSSDDGGWRLTTAATDVPLPSTVQAMYAAQIDDLSPDARSAARRGAVAGRRFPMAALAPLGVPDPEAAVDVLRRRAMVAGPLADPLLGQGYSYRHALLRDAGYASLALAERARLHVRLARWLEDVAGGRAAEIAEVIANHYAAALESAPALQQEVAEGLDRATAARVAASWFERAAEAALAIAAHDAARSLYQRALDLTPEDAVYQRARLLERLGGATAFASDMDEGAATLEQSLELYRTLFGRARAGLAQTATMLGEVWNEQLKFLQAVELADRSLDEIGQHADPETAELLMLRGWSVHNGTDETEGPTADFERALAVARERDDPSLELTALDRLAGIRADEGQATDQELQEVAELASQRGRPDLAARWLRVRAILLLNDRAADAEVLLDQAFEAAQAHGLQEQIAWTRYARAEAGLVAGTWDHAMEEGLLGIELGERNAYHRPVVRTWFALAPILAADPVHRPLDRCFQWFDQRWPSLPSPRAPWAEVMVGAMEVRFARLGLATPVVPPVDLCMPAFDQAQGMPSWCASMEAVLEVWLEAGELGGVRQALDLSKASNARTNAASLCVGTEALMRAKLLRAEGATASEVAAEAERALPSFRKSRAPWWISKTIRVLRAAGAAGPDRVKEADEIEGRLGIAKT